MGFLKNAGERLEKLDEGLVAAKDSFNSQTILNISLSITLVVVALAVIVRVIR